MVCVKSNLVGSTHCLRRLVKDLWSFTMGLTGVEPVSTRVLTAYKIGDL